MKAEFVSIERSPKDTWVREALITVKYTPNWFETLLGKEEHTIQYRGSALTWYSLDFFRADFETEWWLHTIWSKWMTEHGY